MSFQSIEIKTAQHYLDQINFNCNEPVNDFRLKTDYDFSQQANHAHRHNAIVELQYDALGRVFAIEVTILGEEKEPEEEQERIPYEITELGRAMLEEGHPENEREEARIKAVFGLK